MAANETKAGQGITLSGSHNDACLSMPARRISMVIRIRIARRTDYTVTGRTGLNVPFPATNGTGHVPMNEDKNK